MKTLMLIRHGKSDWAAGLSDKERPLSQRGCDDAPMMAQRLRQEGHLPEIMYVSSAKRTTQTARLLAPILNIPKERIVHSPELYLCDAFTIEEVIKFAPINIDTMAIIGHNPTLSDVASAFIAKAYIDMPTLGVFVLSFNTNSWENLCSDCLQSYQFYYPKMG